MQNNLMPPSFGPGSWRDLPEKLVQIYSKITQTQEKTEEVSPSPSEAELEPRLEKIEG